MGCSKDSYWQHMLLTYCTASQIKNSGKTDSLSAVDEAKEHRQERKGYGDTTEMDRRRFHGIAISVNGCRLRTIRWRRFNIHIVPSEPSSDVPSPHGLSWIERWSLFRCGYYLSELNCNVRYKVEMGRIFNHSPSALALDHSYRTNPRLNQWLQHPDSFAYLLDRVCDWM